MARTATCRDCGATWELTQPYGRPPIWCADCRRRRVARLADWLEANCPEQVAWLIGHVPPEVAGEVVDELLRRDQERAGGGGKAS
jgi:hypothetical protein